MSRWPTQSDNDNAAPKTPREERQALLDIDREIKSEQRRLVTTPLASKRDVDALRRSVDEKVKALQTKRARLLRGRAP